MSTDATSQTGSEIRVVHTPTGTRGVIVGPGEVFVAWRNGRTDLIPLADLHGAPPPATKDGAR